jgi:hypothetical protein
MCHGLKFRTIYQRLIVSCVVLAVFASLFTFADSNSSGQKSVSEIVSKAVREHRILYKLTTLDEFKQIVGQPQKETTKTEGGLEICNVIYPDVSAVFGKVKGTTIPFTILGLAGKEGSFDIGKNHQIVLRDINDLYKFDPFWGFVNVSLANLDLRNHKQLLEDMSFDARTKWPEPNKLPEGFDPARLLEEGKNPGLGIRALHKRGIDGRGVAIAILDQPILANHQEYTGKIIHYEGVITRQSSVEGPPVVSIAVGKSCGVAPAAGVYYYALPKTALPDNGIYCDIIDKIIKINESAETSEKIRVVNISTGTFEQQKHFDRWKETLAKADNNGILVVTCDPAFLNYGPLERIPDKDADDLSAYKAGELSRADNVLRVPAGNRTTASNLTPYAYTFWGVGGNNWAAPYLAGLAALAYQVNPEIRPDEIVKLWIETAVKTDAGPIVNPPAFIDAVQKIREK